MSRLREEVNLLRVVKSIRLGRRTHPLDVMRGHGERRELCIEVTSKRAVARRVWP
jgi:hypothetical protein